MQAESLKDAGIATAFFAVSLSLWRLGYQFSDWAALALLPMAVVLAIGFWPLVIHPWQARLRLSLRPQSSLARYLTGRLRATLLSIAFVSVALMMLAWQALLAGSVVGGLIAAALLMSGWLFAAGQHLLERHFIQPFARSYSTSLVTWGVGLPFAIIFAALTWAYTPLPGQVIDAGFAQSLQFAMERLPQRQGWITHIMAVPFAYEAAKLWVVMQLRDYPSVAALFSLDAALFSFVLCRSGIIATQFVNQHITGRQA